MESEECKIPGSRPPKKRTRFRTRDRSCHCCGQVMPFCWSCRCGFAICQVCMQKNVWGMTCNAINWVCPDCGELNGFGNQ